ncbi:hypothetical protein OG194_43290 [Streptomyces sp. NBC_01288]|uniref:hypothetical protein n=1 Tax=Streptomyces sp. NBC_01288 TaxID=2903814 RepID=UPI002E111A40|nr:hypothetical protein OG194_43290 [Streptomyces sp. NBC_01288]
MTAQLRTAGWNRSRRISIARLPKAGQLTLAAGTIDDVVGWVLLSVVSAMATTGVHPSTLATSLMWLVVVAVAAPTVLAGRAAVSCSPGWPRCAPS